MAILSETDSELTYANTIAALDEGLDTLNRAWGLVNHLDSVCNSPELRKPFNKMLPEVSAFFAAIPLNEQLWKTLKAYGDSEAVQQLSAPPNSATCTRRWPTSARPVRICLPSKSSAPQKSKNASPRSLQKYSENCLDATNAWEKVITDKSELSGLPESALAAAKTERRTKKRKAGASPFQAPSYIPVMTYADNDALREEVWKAYAAIGRSGETDNRELVREILDLRHEFAQLVGQNHFADHVTERRMAASGHTALKFGETIFERVRESFEREVQQLRDFKGSELLEPWEVGYWAEKQRLASYDFDEEALRPYFPIDRVISGMYDIAERIFGLNILERSNPAARSRTPNPASRTPNPASRSPKSGMKKSNSTSSSTARAANCSGHSMQTGIRANPSAVAHG